MGSPPGPIPGFVPSDYIPSRVWVQPDAFQKHRQNLVPHSKPIQSNAIRGWQRFLDTLYPSLEKRLGWDPESIVLLLQKNLPFTRCAASYERAFEKSVDGLLEERVCRVETPCVLRAERVALDEPLVFDFSEATEAGVGALDFPEDAAEAGVRAPAVDALDFTEDVAFAFTEAGAGVRVAF